MKIITLIDNVKLLFSQWELGYSIMFSIILQAFLIFSTYIRRNSVGTIRKTLWLGVFLGADFVATLCLGAIFHLPLGPSSSSSNDHNQKLKNLLVIWSPFILLHLGRHGTLIGISLADNEFWLSHFLKFLYYEFTALTISILGSSTRWFNLASRIMLVGGSLKFAERVLAHKKGSMNELRRSIVNEDFPRGLGILEIAGMITNPHIPQHRRGEPVVVVDINVGVENDTNRFNFPPVASMQENVIALCEAYYSFNKHKDLYVEGRSPEDCYRIRDGYWRGENYNPIADAGNAFNIIQIELCFAYDHFYTKMALLHTWWGWIARFVSLLSVGSALVLFYVGVITNEEFKRADKFDKIVTNLLVIMALFLEVGSLLESILSKRFLVQIGTRGGEGWRLLERVIVRIPGRTIITPDTNPTLKIGQFSLLPFCFNDSKQNAPFKWFLGYFDLKQFWNNHRYISHISIEDVHDHQPEERRFLNLVFDSIGQRLRRERTEDDRFRFQSPISAAVLGQLPNRDITQIFEAINARNFEECIIMWHLATDVCYRLYSNFEESQYLQYAKYLSDYMLYLLQAHPSILLPLTTTELQIYRNVCAAINRFYDEMRIESEMITEIVRAIEPIYINLRGIPREERPANITNLLLDGYELAREIGHQRIQEYRATQGEGNIWKVLFEVWVDILSYTAIHVPGKQHAEHLVTGGEFITYIWLFIIYLIEF
ncbi:uncharacterized protein LOC107809279 [Nicotiana tabacum]|uniref:Uncharacterized protein LOC107809279 n=1 Tax=Nicotiana tabacum TaxID=4097 RepID=A0A1S4BKJ4_TOBAC|nr:PREDICTED: uncharacterized protein LOC107809279 [Nicotiana tabacum]XP_018622319.1 uncharacterized protein LOC104084570 [Nicotiana tomentosiformis]